MNENLLKDLEKRKYDLESMVNRAKACGTNFDYLLEEIRIIEARISGASIQNNLLYREVLAQKNKGETNSEL